MYGLRIAPHTLCLEFDRDSESEKCISLFYFFSFSALRFSFFFSFGRKYFFFFFRLQSNPFFFSLLLHFVFLFFSKMWFVVFFSSRHVTDNHIFFFVSQLFISFTTSSFPPFPNSSSLSVHTHFRDLG